jgi:glycosyltransferase involved in cell wall biosynthesis
MMAPLVTVMTPAFNREDTLRATVDSVLSQTVGDLELVVVDDGSSLPVARVLSSVHDPRLKIVAHDRNLGLSAARNTALAVAEAPLVAQLDSDDTWEPRYLERVLPCFCDPRVGLVYTDAYVVGNEHRPRYLDPRLRHPPRSIADLIPECPIPNPTVTMRRDAVHEAGGYARALWSTQDWRLYLELAQRGWRFECIREPLATYRWPSGATSMSHQRRRTKLDMMRMFTLFLISHPTALPAYRRLFPLLARGARRELTSRVRFRKINNGS